MKLDANRQHRRITHETDSIVRFSRIGITYSLILCIIGGALVLAMADRLSQAAIVAAIMACLLFAVVNYAIVLSLLSYHLLLIADVKTPPPPKIEEAFVPVKQYGELKGHVVVGRRGARGRNRSQTTN